MKTLLKKLICRMLPLKNFIVFESNPEFGCNTLPVYEELVKRGIRNKYQIYWLVRDKEKYKNDNSGNKYINYEEKGLSKLKRAYVLCTAKALIFSNIFLKKHQKHQLVVNLMHGSPLKVPIDYHEGDTCDYVITQAEFFNAKVVEALGVPASKMVPLGFPRTDILIYRSDSRKKLNISREYKIIVWMPTFRKNGSSGTTYCDVNKLGVPLLKNEENFDVINSVLEDNRVVLIIKLHPAEDLGQMTLKSYSNISFIDNKELEEKNITVYQLLADSDALITDYSSVYYDYLLVDRPIGLIIDDIKEYEKTSKFAYGKYTDFVKGTYINNLSDFEQFIIDLKTGTDPFSSERRQAMTKYCQYTDFKSTQRVCDFVEEQLKGI